MPQGQPRLDDRYRSGVYYDIEGYEFCRIDVADETGNVVLLTPDERDIYFEYEDRRFNPDDYIQVDQEAVADPVGYVSHYLDLLAGGKCIGAQMAWSEEISLRYAVRQVEISEN